MVLAMTTVKVQDRNSKIVWLFRFLILSLGFWSIADQIFIPDVIRGEVIVANAGHWEFFRGQNAYKKKLSIDSSCRQRSLITSRGCYVGYLLEKFKKMELKVGRSVYQAISPHVHWRQVLRG